MAKKRITSNQKPLTQEQKHKKLEKQISEFQSDYTLKYCFNHFIVEQITKNSAKPTIEFYKRCYKKLCDYFATVHSATPDEIPIDALEMDMLQGSFMAMMKGQNLNEQTINSYLRGYRAFGNWCVKLGYITNFECPIKEVEPPIKTVYTEDELRRLRVKPEYPIGENFLDWRTYIAIGIMLNCGARSNTLLNLKIKDIDFEDGYINLNTTKNRKIARMGLEEEVLLDLQEWINWRKLHQAEDDDYLLCNEYGQQLARSSFTKSVRVYNNRRGVEKTSIHLFRHTFAKNWITSGGDIVTLQRVLTHSELDMVKRYANLYGTDIKKEIQQHSTISQISSKKGSSLRGKKNNP